jgi:hypothetical protein
MPTSSSRTVIFRGRYLVTAVATLRCTISPDDEDDFNERRHSHCEGRHWMKQTEQVSAFSFKQANTWLGYVSWSSYRGLVSCDLTENYRQHN